MLGDRIQGEMVRSLTPSDAARLADQLLSADDLKEEFEGGAIRRKSFCEYLDIGESTLSTWLQNGRVPRMASLSYVLLSALQTLSNEITRRDERDREISVVRGRDGFALVMPATDAADPPQIVAHGIQDYGLAQSLAAARTAKTLEALENAEQICVDRADDEFPFFQEAADALAETRLLLSDYDAWRKAYRPTLADLALD